MGPTDYILLTILLMVGGRYYADWRRHRHMSPHTSYSSLDAAVDAVSRVVAGLHEDLDSLRKELRAAVGLPSDTQVPRLMDELRRTRLLAWTSVVLNIVGGVSLLWLVLGRGN